LNLNFLYLFAALTFLLASLSVQRPRLSLFEFDSALGVLSVFERMLLGELAKLKAQQAEQKEMKRQVEVEKMYAALFSKEEARRRQLEEEAEEKKRYDAFGNYVGFGGLIASTSAVDDSKSPRTQGSSARPRIPSARRALLPEKFGSIQAPHFEPLTMRDRLLDTIPRITPTLKESLEVYSDGNGRIGREMFDLAIKEALLKDGRCYREVPPTADGEGDLMSPALIKLFDELHQPHKGDTGELLKYQGKLLQVDVWENPVIRENPANPRLLPIEAIPGRIIKLRKQRDRERMEQELAEREEKALAVQKEQQERFEREAASRAGTPRAPMVPPEPLVPQPPSSPPHMKSEKDKRIVRKKVEQALARQLAEKAAKDEERKQHLKKLNAEAAERALALDKEQKEFKEQLAKKEKEKAERNAALLREMTRATREPPQSKTEAGGEESIVLGGVAATLASARSDASRPTLRKGGVKYAYPPTGAVRSPR